MAQQNVICAFCFSVVAVTVISAGSYINGLGMSDWSAEHCCERGVICRCVSGTTGSLEAAGHLRMFTSSDQSAVNSELHFSNSKIHYKNKMLYLK